jgi:hypothetical protein
MERVLRLKPDEGGVFTSIDWDREKGKGNRG